MGARVIEYLDELRAVEHRVLVALVKGYGPMRTRTGAEHAEHAGSEVVFVLGQTLAFFSVLCLVHFARYLDCSVGTCHLAKAASYALVFVLLIVRHCQRAAKAFEHHVRGSVFRILFSNLGRKEFTHRGFETRAETL